MLLTPMVRMKVIFTALSISVLCLAGCNKPKTEEFGQKKVASFDLSREEIEKFQNFKPSQPDPNQSTLENISFAETEDWFSPSISVKTAENPYTVVVKLSGTALEEGDSSSLWQTGWGLEGMVQGGMMPGLTMAEAKAGQDFERTATTAPSRFKKDQDVAVSLNLVRLKNLQIRNIHIEVWSGFRSSSWWELGNAFYTALIGLLMVAIWLIWFRPRYASGT